METAGELGYKTFGRNRSLRLPGFDYSAPHVFLVTIVTDGRADVFTVPSYADAVIDCLTMCRHRYHYAVYAFCLMPDHLHLLLTPGKCGTRLPEFIGAF